MRGPAAQFWRHTLSQVPTTFGRLAFIASLRDPATGRYFHESLAGLLGDDDTDRTLCNSHHQVFAQWLSFSLADQMSDLQEYRRSAIHTADYRSLVPATARDVERLLYLTDLETLEQLLRYEPGRASVAPGA